MTWPRAALLSLSDKSGAVEFARALAEHGTRMLASGGTAKVLEQAGIEVTAVEQWTGFPELLGGRVKTLHPHVHAPILARRGVVEDLEALEKRGLEPIDLVAVSLYPFESRAAALDEAGAVEEIDIGGVALLRAAAKNFADVIVVHDPAQYPEVLRALESGGPSLGQRRAWALATFARTARYDAAIGAELARRSGSPGAPESHLEPPPVYVMALERARTLRYGENPQQAAALYRGVGEPVSIHVEREGKELSYNNLVDLHAAVSLCGEFDEPGCVIVKHNEPCGAAVAASLDQAYQAALGTDPLSAFGGIVAFNRPLDRATAQALAAQFVECVAAPEITPAAEGALGSKKNLRLLRLGSSELVPASPWALRQLGPWGLLQREPSGPPPAWRAVTQRVPSQNEMEGLRFAWTVVAAARSNAVAIARETVLIGLGSGQTSRVDAVDVALMKARRVGHDVQGAVLASDGFFPFADNIGHAAQAGISAVVQPGGSVRDAEVIAACDAQGLAMMFTGRRVFRH
ncbi:MAG TPA: bifunctional phosphoribosylaminoimidazolecarboxamide formyltransferase/IMP cyclohydrolase [Candidatus Eisenbacteria bacterium]|jgi:phosphoribosylaminoimidazolecarboxamide formyltransferase/IMP cyclohydrolase